MISIELFQRAVEAAHHGIYVTDPHGHILYANEAFGTLTGYAVDELVGSPMTLLSSGEMPRSYYEAMWTTIGAGERWQEEITNRRRDGSLYHAFQIISPVTADDGSISYYVGIQHDVTADKHIRLNLDQAILDFEAVFANTQDAMFLVDVIDDGRAFRYRRLSTSHERLTGLSTDEVRGQSPEETVGTEQGATIVGHYRRCMQLGQPISYEETLHLPAGERVWHTQLAPVYRDGRIVQLVGSSRDITDRKRLEDDLRYLSEIDGLTGVPNRRKTTEELDRELARAQRHGHALSILMTDIDHFKSVNDELGHEAGDASLRGVASTIQATLRPTDRVGRWGGEEFLVILPETDHPGARTAAERIRRAVEESTCVPGRTVTVSLGVASLGPVRATNPRALAHTVDSLVRIADEELYRAKERGRNQVAG